MWRVLPDGYAETCRSKVTSSHIVSEFYWYLDANGDSKFTE